MVRRNAKPVNLALQGGGAHGAFTWGVLDYLLEDGRLQIAGISGTSAGAMNAVAVAAGWVENGVDGARSALEHFWRAMGDAALLSPFRRSPLDVYLGTWSLAGSPSYHIADALTRTFSPYLLNPLNLNPLLDLLRESIDFERVRACDAFELYVSATNVETGRVEVFDRAGLTPEMVMASACLPFLYQAVEIDGVPYWDGGYMGNPSLFPFHTHGACSDIVIVQINPIFRPGTPTSAHDIQDRVNEIAFNASLLKELRSIDFVARLIEEGKLSPTDYRQQRIHMIHNEDALMPFGAASKLNAEWAFLEKLRDLGRETAARWLDDTYARIGKEQTVDIRAMFQGTGAPTR
ncbi:MAG: patatin-like phospholipase family protein [Paracoccaceae bacterium]|nr:patatin-like phospholipase family protein [Paracoccaceae bacterium]